MRSFGCEFAWSKAVNMGDADTLCLGPENQRVRVVCISDTHNDDCTGSLPDGDVLIHSGDMTDDGTMEELQTAYSWISALPHRVKIIIAGMSPPPRHSGTQGDTAG